MKVVRIINAGDEKKTYRISFQHLRMKEDGTYVEIKKDEKNIEEKFIDDFVIFSPRRVTLKPHESQLVRLMYKRKRDMEDGEYRSHLLFTQEDSGHSNNKLKSQKEGKKELKIELRALVSVSIPVIVSEGRKNGEVEIEKIIPNFKGKEKYVDVHFKRSGNSSIYGDIFLNMVNKNGEEEEIGFVNAISLLYPYSKRVFRVMVNDSEAKLKGSSIEAFFYAREDLGSGYEVNKKKVLAKKIVNLY